MASQSGIRRQGGPRHLAGIPRKMLSILLSVLLAFSVPVPALADEGAPPGAATNEETTTPYIGEGALTLTESAVTIDNVSIPKAQLAPALAGVERLQGARATASCEYVSICSISLSQSNGLLQLGTTLTLAFMSVMISNAVARIDAHGGDMAFMLPGGSVSGLDRDVLVFIDAATHAVFVDGVGLGVCWLAYKIVSHIADNYDSIEVAVWDDNIPHPFPPGDYVSDEQHATITAACASFLKAIQESDTSNNQRRYVSMVTVGFNTRTGKVGMGIKADPKFESIAAEIAWGEYAGLSGVPIVFKYSKTPSDTNVFGDNRGCSEDACMEALGGYVLNADNSHSVSGDVILSMPFRLAIGPGGKDDVGISIRRVCEKCEGHYGRILPSGAFVPGTGFDSTPGA